MKKMIIVSLFMLCLGFVVTAMSDEKLVYKVKRTSEKIYIDGNITEEDWKAAQSVGDFVFPWYKEGKKEQTDARMLWDDEFLYVLFKCEDEHISAHYFERNSAPYKDDCVEVFISPNSKNPIWYVNNEFNCLGTWLIGFHKGDIRGENYVERDKILIGRSHKGTINKENDIDEYWILEIGIPFESLRDYEGQLPPRPGDSWGLDLNRCGGDVNPQYSQWSPSKTEQPDFHRPQDFGKIIFSGETVR